MSVVRLATNASKRIARADLRCGGAIEVGPARVMHIKFGLGGLPKLTHAFDEWRLQSLYFLQGLACDTLKVAIHAGR
jgi:hypothetical protein